MTEPLERFVVAQEPVWDTVRAELSAGRKATHWMWYIFPQLESLGRSPTAKLYGISGPEEARSHLAHPVLGPRLVEAASLLLSHAGTSPERIMGPVDALKLRSSMTLFSRVPGADPVFVWVLDAFYAGEVCPLTVAELEA